MSQLEKERSEGSCRQIVTDISEPEYFREQIWDDVYRLEKWFILPLHWKGLKEFRRTLQRSRHQMDPTWQSVLGHEWGGLEKVSSCEPVEEAILRSSLLRSCQPDHLLKAMDGVTRACHLGN